MGNWLNDEEQCTWRLFLAVTRRLGEALERQCQEVSGIPLTYYIILAMLSEAPNQTLRMSELADVTQSSPSRLSHAVSRLEERGLVTRSRSEEDGRGANATLTPAGLTQLHATAPSHAQAVKDYFISQIPTDRHEMIQGCFVRILSALADSGIGGRDFETIKRGIRSQAPAPVSPPDPAHSR